MTTLKPSTRRFVTLARILNSSVDSAPGVNRDRLRRLLAQELRLVHRDRHPQYPSPSYWGLRNRFACVVQRIVHGLNQWRELAPTVDAEAFCR